MTLSEELIWRGFVNQSTYADLKALDDGSIRFYWGVDPSASSMQIGNLAAAMMVRHFIDHGHKAILLVGGATGMIGDPDGKKDERNLMTVETIENNKRAIAEQYKTVFSGQDFELVDNYEWFKDINYLDFLRIVGKNVPMSAMLGREFIQSRLGEGGAGISYAEFSYSLIQGYDFLHLYQNNGVTLQVCGADQWGNSIAGVDLIRRIAGGEAHVYSTPLVVNKSTGVKFGKSEAGAIWLDAALTSIYKFYQFWLNLDDEGVSDYLKLYTLLTKDEHDDVMNAFESNRASRSAQKVLAYEVTKLVHGEEKAGAAVNVTEVLFGKGKFEDLTSTDMDLLKEELAVANVSDQTGIAVAIVKAGLASSNSEAVRYIESGAISVNGYKVESGNDVVLQHGDNLIKRGKNNFAVVVVG